MAVSTPPSPPPPPAPPSSAPSGAVSSVASLLGLARGLALLIALLAGVLFLVFLGLSFLSVVLGHGAPGLLSAVYCLVSAVVNFVLWREIPRFEKMNADREFDALRDHLLVWIILGVLFFVVVGVLLAIAWVRLEELRGSRPSAPPPPPRAGPSVPPPPPPPGPAPACANCGNPTTWIPEYSRFYCYRCGRYA